MALSAELVGFVKESSQSACDAFMYVVMFATLILSGYNLGDLLSS